MPLVTIDHLEPAAAQERTQELLDQTSGMLLALDKALTDRDKATFDATIQQATSLLHTISEYGTVAFLTPEMTPEMATMQYMKSYPDGYWHALFTIRHAVKGIDPRVSDDQVDAALVTLTRLGYLKMSHRGGGRAQYQILSRRYKA